MTTLVSVAGPSGAVILVAPMVSSHWALPVITVSLVSVPVKFSVKMSALLLVIVTLLSLTEVDVLASVPVIWAAPPAQQAQGRQDRGTWPGNQDASGVYRLTGLPIAISRCAVHV